MDRRPRISFTEWSFVAVLFLLSAVLTALQFSWVGELSRVEAARLKATLEEQARVVAREFDAELADAGRALKPSREELASGDPVAAVVARVRDWQGTKPRPVFRRIAVAVPAGWDAKLTGIDPATGGTSPIEWPEDWTPLRDYVRRMLAGGPPSFHDPKGVLLEFPLMGGRVGRGAGGPESGWLLLQLDLDYLRNTWFPELVASHLDIRGAETCDVTVDVWATGESVWARGKLGKDGTPLKVRFHREGRTGTSGPRAATVDGVWSMRIAPRSGALEAMVGRSRLRNLAIAGVANALIVAAGIALVFHTRRSRELAESRMRFVATVSHELRTPLTVIRAAGHNLLHGIAGSPGKVTEYSRLIIQHADQLKELTEQTLALSAAGRWDVREQGKPVDLLTVLREVVTAASEEARAAQCQLECRLPESLPSVLGDASALRRVFQNLVLNALKHGAGGHWVGLDVTTVEHRGRADIEVRVSDRGAGIPGVERARIFEPFFRGQRAMENQIRGTGLGLSVVREIVGAHGGSVELEPADSGAVFRVRLPVIA